MSSKARELSKFSFDIHVNEGAGTLGIGTTADVGDRLYVEGGAQITGVTTVHSILHSKDKIGIGTENPDKSLSIRSSQSVMLMLEGTSSTSRIGFKVPTTSNPPTIGADNSDDLQIRTGGNERFRIQSGGNIGIGTDTPTTKLHVFGGTTNDQVVTIESSSSSGIGAPDLSLFTNDPAIQNGETIGVLRFDSFNSSGTQVEYSRLTTTVIDNGSGGNASAKVVVQARKDNSTMDTVAEFNGSTGDAKIAAQNGAGIILAAPNGTLYKITVTNAGAINVASA
jgi:hypothetical protein